MPNGEALEQQVQYQLFPMDKPEQQQSKYTPGSYAKAVSRQNSSLATHAELLKGSR